MAITTVALVKSFLHKTDATDDTLLGSIVDWVIGWVENTFCNRTFDSTVYTAQKYDGDGSRSLILRQYPIISIAQIDIDGSTLDSTAYYDPTNYADGIYADLGIVKRVDYGIWIKGFQHIEVTYTAGYATIPEDLELCATKIAADIFNETKTAAQGQAGPIKAEKIGQYSITYAGLENGVVPLKYKMVLIKYRRRA